MIPERCGTNEIYYTIVQLTTFREFAGCHAGRRKRGPSRVPDKLTQMQVQETKKKGKIFTQRELWKSAEHPLKQLSINQKIHERKVTKGNKCLQRTRD